MTFIFYPAHTRTHIDLDKETPRLARKANRETRELQYKLQIVQGQLDRLYMITEAMWFVMKDKLGMDDEGLAQLMEEIDQRVASFDGSATGKCSKCERPLSVRTGTCIYCGNLKEA